MWIRLQTTGTPWYTKCLIDSGDVTHGKKMLRCHLPSVVHNQVYNVYPPWRQPRGRLMVS